jgi:nucleoside-diphosphate-sugar epimerase
VIRRIADAAGRSIPITRSDAEPGDVRRTGADTRQARTQLGWSPAVSLSAGLEAELSWVRTRRASVETAPALAVAS